MSNIRIRVGAFLVKDNSVLLVQHQKQDKSYWLLPGGGVKSGETLKQALIRELKEEVSLEIKPSNLLFICESISPNGRHILHIVFKSQLQKGNLRVNKDKRLQAADYFSEKELKKLTIYPNIKDELIELIKNRDKDIQITYLGNRWH